MKNTIDVVAAVIRKDGKVLMASRPADKPPAGWEFPGGKVEPQETFNKALRRELKEELDLDITPGDEIYCVRTPKITLHFIRAVINGNSVPDSRENQQWAWVPLTKQYPDGILANDLVFWDFMTGNK
jgi:mutator protein MutT